MAASSSILEPWMKRTLHALKQRGLRAGDIFDPNNLPGTRHLLGKLVNFKPVMDCAAEQGWDYAAEQGWVEKLPGGQYRLTDAGFAAASWDPPTHISKWVTTAAQSDLSSLSLPAVGAGVTSTSALARSSGGHGHSQDQFALLGLLIVASVAAAIIVVISVLYGFDAAGVEGLRQAGVLPERAT